MRVFEALDKMNIADGENNTRNVAVCNSFVRTEIKGANGYVTMGAPSNVVMDILNNKNQIILLVVIDREEYDKIQKA